MIYNPKNIIIVGGNAAGPSAAAKAKRVNPDANVIMFESGGFISTGTCELPHVLSGEIEDYKKIVFYDDQTFLKEKGVKVYLNHFVEKIDSRKKKISVRDNPNNQLYDFPYDSLVLTTGSNIKRDYTIPSETENVFYLKTVSDIIKITEYIKSAKANKCLIVGAGYIGLETADALNKIGIKVTMAEKFGAPFPGSEPELQSMVIESLKSNNVDFIASSDPINFVFNGNRVTKFKHDGRLIEIDFVVYSIGFQPNTSLAVDSKIQLGNFGGIKVNKKLQTSDACIFAAGDCIEVTNLITGRNDYIPLATLAHNSGHVAGANAAGGNMYYDPVLKNTAVSFFGNSFTQVGLTFSEAKQFFHDADFVTAIVPNKVKVMPRSRNTFGKIIFRKSNKQVLGASFAGAGEVVGNSDIIAVMITSKIPADNLAKVAFNYTPSLSPFINILSVLGRKIK